MIKTYWTKPEISQKFVGCSTLGDVIKNIEAEFVSHGEVVCEIRVNGLVLKEEDEKKFAESRLDEINELMVQTNAPKTLIEQALSSVLDYLPKAQKACLECADAFRAGEMHEAQQFFQDVVEGCFWVVDTVIHIRGAHENTAQPSKISSEWMIAEKKFVTDLKSLLNASEQQDYILTADLLEYEMSTDLEALLPSLKQYQDQGLVA